MTPAVLLLACGAIARELESLRRAGQWQHVTLRCLDPALHNRPEEIAPAVEAAILHHRGAFTHIFVAYADCGSSGALDRVLERHGIERLPGAHCYEFLAGSAAFEALAAAEPGTFYLTDFLARHFDRLVKRGLGLDRHPQLMPHYFGNYRRLVFLAQTADAELDELARGHADYLGLAYERHATGLAPLARALEARVLPWQN
ncbi:MAG TPA: DUF1638 domain-containing protein [Xanthomonadales bacterium]|nr:DUF1638 domain-containing protein [Xanthomonadales bacterium]